MDFSGLNSLNDTNITGTCNAHSIVWRGALMPQHNLALATHNSDTRHKTLGISLGSSGSGSWVVVIFMGSKGVATLH